MIQTEIASIVSKIAVTTPRPLLLDATREEQAKLRCVKYWMPLAILELTDYIVYRALRPSKSAIVDRELPSYRKHDLAMRMCVNLLLFYNRS